MANSILNGINEEILSNEHNVRIRKFPGATVDDFNYHAHPILRKKSRNSLLSTYEEMMPPVQHLGKL